MCHCHWSTTKFSCSATVQRACFRESIQANACILHNTQLKTYKTLASALPCFCHSPIRITASWWERQLVKALQPVSEPRRLFKPLDQWTTLGYFDRGSNASQLFGIWPSFWDCSHCHFWKTKQKKNIYFIWLLFSWFILCLSVHSIVGCLCNFQWIIRHVSHGILNWDIVLQSTKIEKFKAIYTCSRLLQWIQSYFNQSGQVRNL